MGKRRITVEGFLRLLDDLGAQMDWVFERKSMAEAVWGKRFVKELEEYFPSVLKQVASRLERRGLVRKVEDKEGIRIEITDKGRKEILKFRLDEFEPKRGKWDGLWRIIFFDIPERDKRKREEVRLYLKKLGMERMQDSVFVCPWDVEAEVKYMREVLGVPHAVKLGLLKWLENEEELKEIFEL